MKTIFAALAVTVLVTSVAPASAATIRPAPVEKTQEATKIGYYYNYSYRPHYRRHYRSTYYYDNDYGC